MRSAQEPNPAAGGLRLPARPSPPSLALPECCGRTAQERGAPDMPRGGRQPPDLNHGTARRRCNGSPVFAPGLAALSQRPPRLYVQELAFPGGLRLHTGTGKTARPPGTPAPHRVSGLGAPSQAPTPALGDPSHRAPTPLWVPGMGATPPAGAPTPLWAPGDASLPGSEGCPPCRWPRPASSTAPLRTSPTWPSASSASRSWKAGSRMTTPCK